MRFNVFIYLNETANKSPVNYFTYFLFWSILIHLMHAFALHVNLVAEYIDTIDILLLYHTAFISGPYATYIMEQFLLNIVNFS